MLSANLAVEDVPSYLDEAPQSSDSLSQVTIACINSTSNVTLSGPESAIDSLEVQLRQDGIFAQKLNTGVAYHSQFMRPVAADYIECMGPLEQGTAKLRIPIISTVTGKFVTHHDLCQPEYWALNLTSPVKFADAMKLVISTVSKVKLGLPRAKMVYDIIEIGPHCALRRPCLDLLGQSARAKEVRYSAIMHRSKASNESLLELVGKLFTYGYNVRIDDANKQLHSQQRTENKLLVDMPEYPFNHTQRYWHESRLSFDYRMRQAAPRDVLGSRAQDWNPLEPKWRRFISSEQLPWVGDHMVS